MRATSSVVPGESAVARRDLRVVLQRGARTHRGGTGEESMNGKPLPGKHTMAKRIRELEAELAFYRGLKDVSELRAHAEKAEKERNALYLDRADLLKKAETLQARAEKAQAAETRIREEKAENDLFWSAKVDELQARVAELDAKWIGHERTHYDETKARE